jgi:transposase
LASDGAYDHQIASALHVDRSTVQRTRHRFCCDGLDAALYESPRPGAEPKLDGKGEAFLVALACSKAPEGREHWSMQLLADRLVELEIIDSISDETVRRTLKNSLKPWQKVQWCIPSVDATFVCAMADVLDLYAEPPDAKRPLVCFDEMPYQLTSDVRDAEPCRPGRAAREDYEYKREGTCNFFLHFAPHEGLRHVEVTERRTAVDVAQELRAMVDRHFPEAEKIHLVWDNLNVHNLAVLYLAYSPSEARRIAEKFELHYTPKHGSWLNMAEIEWSVLARQCLGVRMPTRERLAEAVDSWERERNFARATVTWRFTTPAARTSLARLYPELAA